MPAPQQYTHQVLLDGNLALHHRPSMHSPPPMLHRALPLSPPPPRVHAIVGASCMRHGAAYRAWPDRSWCCAWRFWVLPLWHACLPGSPAGRHGLACSHCTPAESAAICASRQRRPGPDNASRTSPSCTHACMHAGEHAGYTTATSAQQESRLTQHLAAHLALSKRWVLCLTGLEKRLMPLGYGCAACTHAAAAKP